MYRYIKVKNNKKLLNDIFRFRCKILCDELKYFDKKRYPDGLERDEYDKYSEHYAVLDEKGEIAATVRLIHHSPIGYPTENHMRVFENIKKSLKRDKLGEISRIFISKQYRNLKDSRKIIEKLISMIYIDLKNNDIEYTFGALEKSFLRLLKIYNINYEIIGDLQEYGGVRYPCLLYTSSLEKDKPQVVECYKIWKVGNGH
ncbi:acyl-homoserine-lactone synthase [Nitrosophilus labii]|uniref:acyl-homoserine-lactone synthase n=1 Tax=Nitrosophilus labii TaxID=2706014 RepID=UPI0018D66C68|nr:GNAT family N-acyltransferase [Nitrosophilus labii]